MEMKKHKRTTIYGERCSCYIGAWITPNMKQAVEERAIAEGRSASNWIRLTLAKELGLGGQAQSESLDSRRED